MPISLCLYKTKTKTKITKINKNKELIYIGLFSFLRTNKTCNVTILSYSFAFIRFSIFNHDETFIYLFLEFFAPLVNILKMHKLI